MRKITSTYVHAKLNRPQIVRRYIDLPHYLNLIASRKLYLSRADTFPDRFEGALTPAIRKALDTPRDSTLSPTSADEYYQRSRIGNFVSCWSLGGRDNMALWQLYGGVTKSVAVTSTIGRLIDMAETWDDDVHIERIEYIDHFKNPDMILGRYTDPLRFKHESYEYEREVRIIVPRQGKRWKVNPPGIRLPISDINRFIRSVVVAPEAKDWFYDLIVDVSQKYGVTSPIRRSKLTYLP